MKNILSNIVSKCFTLAIALTVLSGGTASSYAVPSRTHGRFSGNLAECLRYVAREYQVPIIAELVYPLPRFTLPAEEHTAIELLNKLRSKAPTYAYDMADNNVIHFYSKPVQAASGNFLNIRLEQFTMPSSVSDLKITLPSAINSARHSLNGLGVVTSGVSPAELDKEKLKQVRLRDTSARQVLLQAAAETSGFFTIVVFPNDHPRSEADFNYANQHWFWGALSDKDSKSPIYIQPPPKVAAN